MGNTGLTRLYREAVAVFAALSICVVLTACKGTVGGALSFSAQQDGLRPLDTILKHNPDYGQVTVNFCTDKAVPTPVKLKYLFIVDKSTSNARNYTIDAAGNIVDLTPRDILGTDPSGDRRYKSLLDFISANTDDPMKYYAMISFSTSTKRETVGFTNVRTDFLNTVQTLYDCTATDAPGCPNDTGATDYNAALDDAYNLINSDITAARAASDPVASAYVVIFLSDGFPILSITPADPNIPGDTMKIVQRTPDEVLTRVRNLVGLENNIPYVYSVNLYTGYYYVTGNEDPKARDLLARMAKDGKGIPSNFGSGEAIDFTRFDIPPNLVKNILKDVMVENTSAVWWSTGKILRDSDSDGLPDEVELSMGSNWERKDYNADLAVDDVDDATARDSDGNGVSDLIEYRVFGTPCKVNPCNAANRRNFQPVGAGGCSAIVPKSSTGGRLIYNDSDFDGLNDCEESFLGNLAGRKSPDSNADNIADGPSYMNFLDMTSSSNAAGSDPFFDGMTIYNKIKFGLPTFLPLNNFVDLLPYTYDLTLTSSSGTDDCYLLNVYDVTLSGPDNLIRVYLHEETNLVFKKQIYHRAEKRFAGGSKSLVIGDVTAEAPGVWH